MLADDWIAFEAYLNMSKKLLDLFSGGYGLLAEGPKFLIDAYETVLNNHSLRPSRTNKLPNQRWVKSKFVPVTRHLAMIHFGESFIVAKKFEAKCEYSI